VFMQFIGCKFYVQLVICRTYSFLRAAEFEAEPQNLLFCGILIFPWNFAESRRSWEMTRN